MGGGGGRWGEVGGGGGMAKQQPASEAPFRRLTSSSKNKLPTAKELQLAMDKKTELLFSSTFPWPLAVAVAAFEA